MDRNAGRGYCHLLGNNTSSDGIPVFDDGKNRKKNPRRIERETTNEHGHNKTCAPLSHSATESKREPNI